MPQGTIWVEQRSKRTGELLLVGIVCPECAKDLPPVDGWSQRPWKGEERECSWCGDDLAPELKPSKLVAVLALVLLMAAPALAQTAPAQERLVEQVKWEVTLAPLVLHGLDLGLTEAGVAGGAVEANPLMRGSFERRLAIKAVVASASIVAMRKLAERRPKAARVANWAFCGVLAGVVVNNAIVLARQPAKR